MWGENPIKVAWIKNNLGEEESVKLGSRRAKATKEKLFLVGELRKNRGCTFGINVSIPC